MVGAPGLESGAAQLGPQIGRLVDPHVAALDEGGVVLVRQRPADPFGQPRGNGDGHGAAGAKHPGQLADGGLVVGDVLQDFGGDDPVEGPVGERQPGGVAAGGGAAAGRRDVPGLVHGRRHGGHVLELGLVVVEGDDAGAPAQRLEGVAAGAAAQIEQAVSGREPEAVVVDGEHQAVRRSAGGRRGSAGPLVEEDPVLLDGSLRRVSPRPLIDDPLPPGGANGCPQLRAGPAPNAAWRPAPRCRPGAPRGRSRRRGRRPRAGRPRRWPPMGCRTTSPRSPAARIPRTATAPRPAGPRRRAR